MLFRSSSSFPKVSRPCWPLFCALVESFQSTFHVVTASYACSDNLTPINSRFQGYNTPTLFRTEAKLRYTMFWRLEQSRTWACSSTPHRCSGGRLVRPHSSPYSSKKIASQPAVGELNLRAQYIPRDPLDWDSGKSRWRNRHLD